MKRFLVPLAAALFLASCVGIDADARIGADGAVELAITYTVPSALDQFGRLDANAAYLPLPIARADLELAASRAGGNLRAWSRSETDSGIAIKAELRFPDPLSFARFMDPELSMASYAASGGVKTLSLRLISGTPPDPDWAAFLRTAFGDKTISLRFTLPQAPVSHSGATLSGRALSFSQPAAELYASAQPVIISFSWR